MFGRPTEIPAAAQALPGRAESVQFDPKHKVLGTSMVEPFPEDCEQVVFGLGCFWGAERLFWNLPGVFTTAVGYTAGHTPNPSYQEVCTGMTGHNEVVLVVYRPQEIDFEALLRVFWESHDPTQGMRQGNDQGTQYRSGIYCSGDSQREAAENSLRRYQQSLEQANYASITTELLPAGPFYYARTIISNTWKRIPGGIAD